MRAQAASAAGLARALCASVKFRKAFRCALNASIFRQREGADIDGAQCECSITLPFTLLPISLQRRTLPVSLLHSCPSARLVYSAPYSAETSTNELIIPAHFPGTHVLVRTHPHPHAHVLLKLSPAMLGGGFCTLQVFITAGSSEPQSLH